MSAVRAPHYRTTQRPSTHAWCDGPAAAQSSGYYVGSTHTGSIRCRPRLLHRRIPDCAAQSGSTAGERLLVGVQRVRRRRSPFFRVQLIFLSASEKVFRLNLRPVSCSHAWDICASVQAVCWCANAANTSRSGIAGCGPRWLGTLGRTCPCAVRNATQSSIVLRLMRNVVCTAILVMPLARAASTRNRRSWLYAFPIRSSVASFLSSAIHPGLVERFRSGAPFNEPDRAIFYGGGEHGYID